MAGNTLIIVESAAKAKTISKFLGKGYRVKASVGHIKDLPKSKIGIDIENDFEPLRKWNGHCPFCTNDKTERLVPDQYKRVRLQRFDSLFLQDDNSFQNRQRHRIG